MGYIKFQTKTAGEQIVDGKRILNVNYDKSNGNYIEFILDFVSSTGNQPIQLRLSAVNPGSITEQTLVQYNNAVIAAQNEAVVVVNPLHGQEINNILYNPAP